MSTRISEAVTSLHCIYDVISFIDAELAQVERGKVDRFEQDYFKALRYLIKTELKRVIEKLEE